MPRIRAAHTIAHKPGVSYTSPQSCSAGYNRYAELSSSVLPPVPSSRIDTSTSALLKALDQRDQLLAAGSTTKSKVRKRRRGVAAIGDDVASEPRITKRRKVREATPNVDAQPPPPPEKRGAIFKKKCPKNIIDRVERVISQRFFMLDRRRNDDELREEFKVLGSTGNVYTVTIDKRPSCTCPDSLKGNHCKHILFIICRVLQVPQSSTHWYQKALLTSELEEIFREAPPAPTATVNPKICEAYLKATGRASSSANSDQTRRMPSQEDNCPICYEEMHNVQESVLIWCETCGNALHKECFHQWAKKKSVNLDCVYCRAPWTGPGARNAGIGGSNATSSEGYLNLAYVAGVSPVRDTSSYYQGPRRGQRYYGYRNYDDY